MTLNLVRALGDLHATLAHVNLPVDVPGVDAARQHAAELADQLHDYLIPRLNRLDAPLLAVIGGSTGSGKSTITNSLVGADVSPAGVLRPTTRAPTLLCHPNDLSWFEQGDVLPDLPRVSGSGVATGAVLKVVPVDTFDAGIAIIDAPDIDSIEVANRQLATQLLSAADLWLFTTTAVRYADAVPWEFLRRARDRGAAMAIIINRIPPGAADEIVGHLSAMLDDAGTPGVPIFAIDEAPLADGLLPAGAIEPLREYLESIAGDQAARAEIVRQTLDGALRTVPERARAALAAQKEQDATAARLITAADDEYAEAIDDLADGVKGGQLLRGEVLDRWQELIGTAELMKAVQSRLSAWRDRLVSAFTGRARQAHAVQGEITSVLEQLLVDTADAAALNTTERWRRLEGGRQVLSDNASLETASDQFRASVPAEMRAWQDDVLGLVRSQAAGKRTTARILAAGVNSIGVALMIVLFAQTGGVTGGEVAIAGGTAAVSQALLNAVFGEQAVRELAATARRLLMARLERMFGDEAARFRQQVASVMSPPGVAAELERDIDAVTEALR